MLNNLKYFIAVVPFLLSGCARQAETERNPSVGIKAPKIHEVIRKLSPISLPYVYDFSNEMAFSAIKLDFPFSSQTFPDWPINDLIGYLPDTTNWFAVLGLFSGADFALPVLFIIDKQGNQIDEILLSVSKCGSGGQFFCNAQSELKSGNRFSLHSLAISADWNDEGEMSPADTIEVNASGWITPEGKIKMSEGKKPGTD